MSTCHPLSCPPRAQADHKTAWRLHHSPSAGFELFLALYVPWTPRNSPRRAIYAVSQFWDKNSLSYSSVMGLPLAKDNEKYSLVASAFYIVRRRLPTSRGALADAYTFF